jgi:hypothetical protein
MESLVESWAVVLVDKTRAAVRAGIHRLRAALYAQMPSGNHMQGWLRNNRVDWGDQLLSRSMDLLTI